MQGGFVVSPPRASLGVRPQNDRGGAESHSVAIGLNRQFSVSLEMVRKAHFLVKNTGDPYLVLGRLEENKVVSAMRIRIRFVCRI